MAKVGVPFEGEAVHLPRLALVPFGAVEDVVNRRHRGRLVVEVGLQRDPQAPSDGVQPGEDLETGVAAGDPGDPAFDWFPFGRLEGGHRSRLTGLGLGVVLGLRLLGLLGVGRLVGVGLGLDRQRLGILGVGRRGHPVEPGQEVEVAETHALAGLDGAPPVLGADPHPEIAALDVRSHHRVAEDSRQLVQNLLASGIDLRRLLLLLFGVS